jgi:DNA modification methylase
VQIRDGSNGRGSSLFLAKGKDSVYESDRRHPRTVLRFDIPRHKGRHPTEKPVDLLRYLIRTYSNPGDTIADPTMGSASCAEACALEGRSFFGCELDEKWKPRAEERVERALSGNTAPPSRPAEPPINAEADPRQITMWEAPSAQP